MPAPNQPPFDRSHADVVFQSTRWSMVLSAGQETAESRLALEQLCTAYWYPLYGYARRRGYDREDSKDLVQGFFAQLLEKERLAVATPERGRFRAFLLTSFKNYAANQWRSRSAERRGGLVKILSIDHDGFEQHYLDSLAQECPVDQFFERCWVDAVFTQVFRLLECDYAAADHLELFHALRPHLAGGISLDEVGQSLGLSRDAVAMSLYRMRKQFGKLLRQVIASTVVEPDEVDEELARLMAALE